MYKVQNNSLDKKVNNLVLEINNLDNIFDEEDTIEYLIEKVKTLENKLPKKKIKSGNVKNKDLEDVVEGLIEGLEEIDDYLPDGLNSATELIEENEQF